MCITASVLAPSFVANLDLECMTCNEHVEAALSHVMAASSRAATASPSTLFQEGKHIYRNEKDNPESDGCYKPMEGTVIPSSQGPPGGGCEAELVGWLYTVC